MSVALLSRLGAEFSEEMKFRFEFEDDTYMIELIISTIIFFL